jgi:hypothetical protein
LQIQEDESDFNESKQRNSREDDMPYESEELDGDDDVFYTLDQEEVKPQSIKKNEGVKNEKEYMNLEELKVKPKENIILIFGSEGEGV